MTTSEGCYVLRVDLRVRSKQIFLNDSLGVKDHKNLWWTIFWKFGWPPRDVIGFAGDQKW